jgi:phosphate transport system permease protein
MPPIFYLLFLLILFSSFLIGQSKAKSISGVGKLHSLPSYHGYYAAIWCGLPALLVVFFWSLSENWFLKDLVLAGLDEGMAPNERDMLFNEILVLADGNLGFGARDEGVAEAAARFRELQGLSTQSLLVVTLALMIAGGLYARTRISLEFRARHVVERVLTGFLILSSTVALLTTFGIVASLVIESWRFFELISPVEFLFGLKWYPQIAIRADQAAGEGAFGAIPLFTGTLLISAIAMLVAVPIGLFSAIYFSEYASKHTRALIKPMLEILAGIPTVVYGFFAALTVAPWIRETGVGFGLEVSAQSALAAGAVMGIMIIPFISSLSDDVINAVPQTLRDGSYAMGATKSETIKQVILPAALPGVVGAVLLAVSRAIGETMIVVMAAGLAANLTANPLENVTTVTVQIVVALIGDQEFDDPKTLSAFALGLVLFLVTLALNVVALQIVKKYREKYD